MSHAVVTLRIALVRTPFAIARRLPLRHRVLLATAHADGIGGNLASIRDDLARRGIPVVVLADRPRSGWRGRIGAAWHAIRAGYHLATSSVIIVDDYFFPIYVIRPRPATTIVQTWHACGAFKKFGYSLGDKTFGATEALTDRVRIHSNYDVCLVSSMSVAPHYAEAFGLRLDVFRSDLGIPRTDVLFGEERIARTVSAVRRRYAIPDLRLMQQRLGEDHVVLVRLHPFVQARSPLAPELGGFVIDVSDHPDVNELLLASDVLITDYSSVIYEFVLLGRPMAFFAPDHEAYERERGFYFDYRTGVPGPVFETTPPLVDWLRAGTFDLRRVAAFRDASFDVADGSATERFVERIVVPAL